MSSEPEYEKSSHSLAAIESVAAVWLSLRDRGMSPAETTVFMQWLQEDPRHAAVFDELEGLWKDCDRLGENLSSNPKRAPNPHGGDRLVPRLHRRRVTRWQWVAFSAAAAIAVFLLDLRHRNPTYTAETTVGAIQRLELPDGSVAQLNTESAITADFTAGERRVHLIRGEVHFTVAKEPGRPFVVTAGPVAVRAVGTAFNVRRRDAIVEVLVTEGRVRLEDGIRGRPMLPPVWVDDVQMMLGAEELAIVAATGTADNPVLATPTIRKLSSHEIRRALAWQEHRLEFDATPLADVVREFNRYSHIRIVIADEQLATRRFSGSFRADGRESFVRLLEDDFGVSTVRGSDEVVLSVRR